MLFFFYFFQTSLGFWPPKFPCSFIHLAFLLQIRAKKGFCYHKFHIIFLAFLSSKTKFVLHVLLELHISTRFLAKLPLPKLTGSNIFFGLRTTNKYIQGNKPLIQKSVESREWRNIFFRYFFIFTRIQFDGKNHFFGFSGPQDHGKPSLLFEILDNKNAYFLILLIYFIHNEKFKIHFYPQVGPEFDG